MADGIKIGSPPECSLNADCVDCLRAGQHRHLSHAPSRGTSRKLELIHIDTRGPMRTPAIANNKNVYFVVFVDDFTRMIWTYGLEKKDHVAAAIVHFVAHSERESCQHVCAF